MCERAFRSQFTLREEGQVELFGGDAQRTERECQPVENSNTLSIEKCRALPYIATGVSSYIALRVI